MMSSGLSGKKKELHERSGYDLTFKEAYVA